MSCCSARTNWRQERSVSVRHNITKSHHFPDGDNLEDDADGVDQKSNNDGFSVLGLDETPEEAGNKDEIDEEISLLGGNISEYHQGGGAGLTVMGHERRAKEIQRRWSANTALYFFFSMLAILVLQ